VTVITSYRFEFDLGMRVNFVEEKHMTKLGAVVAGYFRGTNRLGATEDEVWFWIVVSTACAVWAAAAYGLMCLI
jgi:hypothetical protein